MVRERLPASHDDPIGITQSALLKMSESMGRVAGVVEQVDGRLDRIETKVDVLTETNHTQHNDTAERLGGIEAQLEAEKERRVLLEERVGKVEGVRANPGDPVDKWDKILDLTKKHWPGVAVVVGVIWTAIEKFTNKGAATP